MRRPRRRGRRGTRRRQWSRKGARRLRRYGSSRGGIRL